MIDAVAKKDVRPVSYRAMSHWGRRVAWLRIELGMTYRSIAKEAGIPFDRLYRMAVLPEYEPKWDMGMAFNAFFDRKLKDAIDGEWEGVLPPDCNIAKRSSV